MLESFLTLPAEEFQSLLRDHDALVESAMTQKSAYRYARVSFLHHFLLLALIAISIRVASSLCVPSWTVKTIDFLEPAFLISRRVPLFLFERIDLIGL